MELGSSSLNLDPAILLPEGMRQRQPGVYADVADDLYHAFDACNQSTLKILKDRSPHHAREAAINPPPISEASLRTRNLGSALHALVLQPQRFDQMYVVAKQCESRTGKNGEGRCSNPGKVLVDGKWRCGVHRKGDAYDKLVLQAVNRMCDLGYFIQRGYSFEGDSSVYLECHSGERVLISAHAPNDKTLAWMLRNNVRSIRVDLPPYGSDDPRVILPPDGKDSWETCQRMRDAVMANPTARFIFEHAELERELTVLWEYDHRVMHGDEEVAGKLLCKSRLDGLLRSHGLIADLKSTVDASREAFSRSLWNYGYHNQGWFYQSAAEYHGIDVSDYNIIAVEKDEPFGCQVFRLDDVSLNIGGDELAAPLATYAKCYATGEWPGYQPDIADIAVPEWVQRRYGLS